MLKFSEIIEENDGEILLNSKVQKVTNFKDNILVEVNEKEFSFDLLINCTGLHSDRNFKNFTKKKRPLQIIPFRGEYLMFKPEFKKLVNHLIYPVPDPNFPFLGVHFTRLINDTREVGPNAVFAFKREGYSNKDISLNDTIDSLTYKGFIKFLSKNFKFSLEELSSSIFVDLFIKKAKKMIPEINSRMFDKGTAGVRAQAMDFNGDLIMDFRIINEGNQIHVLNAPSPGATASLAIADYIIKDINF